MFGLALIVVLAAVVMLQRTLSTAHAINARAASIASSGRGINAATDSIIQLDHTNALGGSILAKSQPLQGQLEQVIAVAASIRQRAESINGSAGSINTSARAINQSGSTINASAHGIDGEAGQILAVAGSIKDGAAKINVNVDGTLALAGQIVGDTGNIVRRVGVTGQNAACIDRALFGSAGGCN